MPEPSCGVKGCSCPGVPAVPQPDPACSQPLWLPLPLVLLHLTFLLRLIRFVAAHVPWGEQKGRGRDGVFSVPGRSRSSSRCRDGEHWAELGPSRDYRA